MWLVFFGSYDEFVVFLGNLVKFLIELLVVFVYFFFKFFELDDV